MPIYEYECQSCGHQLEKLQKMSDAPLTQCPVCKKSALSRLISAAGFQLKGSGWYETDFKSKKSSLTSADSKVEGGSGNQNAKPKPSDTKIAPSTRGA